MKTLFASILLIALVALVPSSSCAQAADTVIVAALPPGNLNAVINADTLAGGIARHPNRVWLLKQTGAKDTIYYLTAQIQVTSLNLVGVTNPNTKFPPVVAPFILNDNSSVTQFINLRDAKTLYCKNIYFLGTRPDGATVTGTFANTAHDSSTFRLDRCVFENFGSTGTPNLLGMGGTYIKVFVTNCMFRNCQNDVPQNPGFLWMGSGKIPMDTAVFKNNTWFITGGAIIGGSPYCAYELFEHNTVFNQTKGAIITQKQLYNAYIKNNVFYNCYATGMDSLHALLNWNANFFTTPAIISTVDTVINLLANVDSTKTDKNKVIQIDHNCYFWNSRLVAAWPQMSVITRALATPAGPVVPPQFLGSQQGKIWWDKTRWPGVIVANNDSVDPGFNATLAQTATDSLINFCKIAWRTNGATGGARPFIYLSDPTNMFAGVPANWATTQGYPVRENLRYTNTALMTRGTDGLPLGDLNWFPEKMTGVSETQNILPTEFSVSQNYPNPFNPSTDIKVSLNRSGAMSLTIYNLLGQVMQVVDQGDKQAGEYIYNVNMDKFVSGVYFYTLRQGNNSISKKMLLLK